MGLNWIKIKKLESICVKSNGIFRHLIIVMFFLVVILMLIPRAFAQEDVVNAIYKEGLRKYILGDYSGAVKDFESALKISPNNERLKKIYVATLIKLGNLEVERGNLNEALEFYSRAYSISEEPYLKENIMAIQKKIEEQNKLKSSAKASSAELVSKSEKTSAPEEMAPAQKKIEQVSKPVEYTPVPAPINLDKIIAKQAEETKKLLAEIMEAQKSEQEKVLETLRKNQDTISKTQETLSKTIEEQNMERQSLYQNLEKSWQTLNERIKAEKEERTQLVKNIERNQKLLETAINSQIRERDAYLKQIKNLLDSQHQDRRLFTISLIILAIGAIIITFIIFMGFLSYYRKHLVKPIQELQFQTAKPMIDRPDLLLEYQNAIAETLSDAKYLTDERYSDMVRLQNLNELYNQLKKGTISWELLERYITELSSDMKSEILSLIESKLEKGEVKNKENAVDVLLPLLVDGEEEISSRSKTLIKKLKHPEIDTEGYDIKKLADSIDPLSFTSLLSIAKLSDLKTGRIDHSIKVAELVGRIAEELNNPQLDPEITKNVGLAHDIGYLEVPESVFKNKGKLSEEEFEIIKTHTLLGVHLLQDTNPPEIFIEGIKYHHERIDGTGYPEGLRKDEIPLIAKVLSVADFFDALTSKRSYRPAKGIEECLELMESLSGTVFDEEIFRTLEKIIKREKIK